METVWLITAWILALLGVVGALVPILPGPLLAFGGLLAAAAAGAVEMSATAWCVWSAVMVAVSLVDYLLPGWMARRFGGSKAGAWGATIGAIAGLFFGPIGVLVGPFVGAVVGELLHSGVENFDHAVQVGIGSFLAFIAGSGIKLIFALCVIGKIV